MISRKQIGGGMYTEPFRNCKNQNRSRTDRSSSTEKKCCFDTIGLGGEVGESTGDTIYYNIIFKYCPCHWSLVGLLVYVFDSQGKTTRWSKEKRRKPTRGNIRVSRYSYSCVQQHTYFATGIRVKSSLDTVVAHRPLLLSISQYLLSRASNIIYNNIILCLDRNSNCYYILCSIRPAGRWHTFRLYIFTRWTHTHTCIMFMYYVNAASHATTMEFNLSELIFLRFQLIYKFLFSGRHDYAHHHLYYIPTITY